MRGQKGDRERAGGKAEDQGGDRGAEGTDGREGVQEGLGQGLRGRGFRRGGMGGKERGRCGETRSRGTLRGGCLRLALTPPCSSFLQIPEEVGIR